MKIINLIEDTPGQGGCLYEHGLSFYIETEQHKLLMDCGATDAFLHNAAQKNIDLTLVDTVIISHGHYDHTGGLLAFAARNPHARIYIHKNATGEFYNLKNRQTKYIGMDPRISRLPQVTFLERADFANGSLELDPELSLFSGIPGKRLLPKGNLVLKKKCGESFLQDEFDHEQYLVVTEGDRRVLLSGCAHNGILNILDRFDACFGGAPTHVISGFHTTKDVYTPEDDALILQTAQVLASMKHTAFYTGHCTGEHPMQLLQGVLGDRLTVMHSGDEIF